VKLNPTKNLGRSNDGKEKKSGGYNTNLILKGAAAKEKGAKRELGTKIKQHSYYKKQRGGRSTKPNIKRVTWEIFLVKDKKEIKITVVAHADLRKRTA